MSASPISLRDETGVERFRGTQSPGGGSMPAGVIQAADFVFTEEATAGVYTAPPLTLPVNAILLDVQWWPTGDNDTWAADTVLLSVTDSAIGGLTGDIDVKSGAGSTPISAAVVVGLSNAYVFPNLAGGVDPTEGTLTTTLTTTIASPPVVPVGVLVVRVFYLVPPTPVPAPFVAAP